MMRTPIVSLNDEGRPPRENYYRWKRSMVNRAAEVDTRNNARFGSMGLVMSEDDYNMINNNVPYALLAEPAEPEDTERSTCLFKEATEKKTQQAKEHADFKIEMLESVGPAVRTLLEKPFPILLTWLTLFDIVEFVDKTYGMMDPTQFATIKANFLDPIFDPSSMTLDEYAAKHQQAANISAEQGQEMLPSDRVVKLIAGLKPCGLYNDTILL